MTTSAPTHPSLCPTSPTEPAQTLKVFLRQIRLPFRPHRRRRRACLVAPECPARVVFCRRPRGDSSTYDRRGRRAGVLLPGKVLRGDGGDRRDPRGRAAAGVDNSSGGSDLLLANRHTGAPATMEEPARVLRPPSATALGGRQERRSCHESTGPQQSSQRCGCHRAARMKRSVETRSPSRQTL
jgi:hypothetical protein